MNLDKKLRIAKMRLILFRLFCYTPIVIGLATLHFKGYTRLNLLSVLLPQNLIIRLIVLLPLIFFLLFGTLFGYLVESKETESKGFLLSLRIKTRKWLYLE